MTTLRTELISAIAEMIDETCQLKHGSYVLAEDIIDEILRRMPVKSGRNYTVDKAISRIRDADLHKRPVDIMDCEIVFAAYHALTEAPAQMNTDLFKPIPDAGGWFDWDGTQDCPVPLGTRVEARMRNGKSTGVVLASTIQWGYLSEHTQPWDIVAYRPLSENNMVAYLDMPKIRDRIQSMRKKAGTGGAQANYDELLEIADMLLQDADKMRHVNAVLLDS